jgi:hypothetical protein
LKEWNSCLARWHHAPDARANQAKASPNFIDRELDALLESVQFILHR